jgi:delta8-fatty-acid desaturase
MINARIWTRDEVAAQIMAGDILIVKDGLLLKVPQSWLERHPGGRLAILHFVGRDATDEIHAYHPDASLRQMESFVVGRIESGPADCWKPLVPPVTLGWRRVDDTWNREAEAATHTFTKESALEPRVLLVQRSTLDESAQIHDGLGPTASAIQPLPSSLCASMQQQHSVAYAKLHQKIKDDHLYTTSFISGYGPELFRYLILAALSVIAYTYGWFLLSATFLGALWHQLTFIAHDLGHNGVTHNRIVDRILGITVAGLMGGLSIGWWVDVSYFLYILLSQS